MSETASTKLLACSFCRQSSDAVERLFAGPDAAICDGCIRSLAEMEALDLPPSMDSAAQIIGRWIRRGEGVSVSLRFTEEDIVHSIVVENGNAKTKLLRYSLDGDSLSTVELLPTGARSVDRIEIEGDTLTIRSKRGTSVFDRDKSDI